MDPGKTRGRPPGYGSCKGLPLRNAWTCRDGRPTLNSIASPWVEDLGVRPGVAGDAGDPFSPVLCTSKITFAVPGGVCLPFRLENLVNAFHRARKKPGGMCQQLPRPPCVRRVRRLFRITHRGTCQSFELRRTCRPAFHGPARGPKAGAPGDSQPLAIPIRSPGSFDVRQSGPTCRPSSTFAHRILGSCLVFFHPRGFVCPIMNDATLKQIAAVKATANKGNHIWT
jgi:hypothetical protein